MLSKIRRLFCLEVVHPRPGLKAKFESAHKPLRTLIESAEQKRIPLARVAGSMAPGYLGMLLQKDFADSPFETVVELIELAIKLGATKVIPDTPLFSHIQKICLNEVDKLSIKTICKLVNVLYRSEIDKIELYSACEKEVLSRKGMLGPHVISDLCVALSYPNDPEGTLDGFYIYVRENLRFYLEHERLQTKSFTGIVLGLAKKGQIDAEEGKIIEEKIMRAVLKNQSQDIELLIAESLFLARSRYSASQFWDYMKKKITKTPERMMPSEFCRIFAILEKLGKIERGEPTQILPAIKKHKNQLTIEDRLTIVDALCDHLKKVAFTPRINFCPSTFKPEKNEIADLEFFASLLAYSIPQMIKDDHIFISRHYEFLCSIKTFEVKKLVCTLLEFVEFAEQDCKFSQKEKEILIEQLRKLENHEQASQVLLSFTTERIFEEPSIQSEDN